ncbi:Transcription factor vib-1 [Escovopsis weberi]|uniref:Transcription factor vib-1 n=1 Tax=Escovopsis weberi TaxID=150374 RepID=A0A0M8N2H7_ESCWE|nr:Transcription factor vib-1 [Escovopsis weberi]
MTAAAYPATMTADPCLRGETGHTNFWSNYNGSAHLSNRLSTAMDPGFHSSTSPSLSTQSQHTYPSLKRPYSQTEPAAYQEMVQDLRDEGSRLTVNQDHKLLSFRRAHDKHTIVDQHGRMQQLELSAQLHGMFFLSEMPSTASDGSTLQPELTCYRRNLFQISGSLITPRGQLSVINESNESVPVSSMEVAVSAIESVDGNPVRLIVIPWKTPPPNTPEINQGPDQEPSALPLIPFQGDSAEPDGEYAVYPIGWRRLQFRIATANNGRRKELQQHFVLHLKVFGTLADSSKVVLSEATTAPIVVRGRSPRNFQTRKEIPLLGSSAGSRGQALVETGLGVVAGALSVKPQELKRTMDMQLPRSSFTYGPPKMPGVPQLSSMRPSSMSVPRSSRDYYPSSSAWAATTAAETSSTVAYSHGDGRPYTYSHDHYKVTSSNPASAKMESRGYDSLNNYSWSPN